MNNELNLYQSPKALKVFINYCCDFYFNETATFRLKDLRKADLISACKLVQKRKDCEFLADSTDREKVRDILLDLGYEHA
jgi:hypothetical protein